MYQMVEKAATSYPDDVAYEFYDRKTCYHTFLKQIDQAARAFTAAGIRRDDRVTICLPNIPHALIAFYALSRIGAVANMIHPLSAQNEITFYLTISKSKMIVTADLFCEKVARAIDKVPQEGTVIVTRMQDFLAPHMALAFTLTKGRAAMKYPRRLNCRCDGCPCAGGLKPAVEFSVAPAHTVGVGAAGNKVGILIARSVQYLADILPRATVHLTSQIVLSCAVGC